MAQDTARCPQWVQARESEEPHDDVLFGSLPEEILHSIFHWVALFSLPDDLLCAHSASKKRGRRQQQPDTDVQALQPASAGMLAQLHRPRLLVFCAGVLVAILYGMFRV